MKVTFLGTGTSHGVPMIGCDCPVCTSNDPRNKRMRSSVLVETDGVSLIIDTGPEMRMQVLREDVRHIDAVLITHAHADHIFGLDDIRRFNDLSGKSMPCFGSEATLHCMRNTFDYVFTATQVGGGLPQLELVQVDGPFEACGVGVTPIPILHGRMHIFGYRIGDFAYITDCSQIPQPSEELLRDLDTLVLGVIRHEPHATHFCVSQALAVVEKLQPRHVFFTHIAHKLDHDHTNRALPPDVQLAYDGLKIKI
ncbi:MAG: MBL fold metallo-hydrolase [Armatimonadota bacterium]|nr:MBL fold metallo-hydrolase [bacterium]